MIDGDTAFCLGVLGCFCLVVIVGIYRSGHDWFRRSRQRRPIDVVCPRCSGRSRRSPGRFCARCGFAFDQPGPEHPVDSDLHLVPTAIVLPGPVDRRPRILRTPAGVVQCPNRGRHPSPDEPLRISVASVAGVTRPTFECECGCVFHWEAPTQWEVVAQFSPVLSPPHDPLRGLADRLEPR